MKKREDATKKKVDEDAAKKAKEDADKKKLDDAAGENKAEEDAAKKKAEAKRQDDLNKHMTQPLYMHSKAGDQFMKDNPDLEQNGKLIYIPGLYFESMEVLLYEVAELSWLSAESRL